MKFKQRISKEIFQKKYMINGETSIQDTFKGIAEEIGKNESKEIQTKFYDEISRGRLIPAGRILANARPNSKMPYYNNCYTIGIDDDLDDIYTSIKEDATISAAGGGVGINFSNLRPKGEKISSGGKTSGVLSFMKVFNESAKIIQTGGGRRSAHIGILNVDHPEIEDFILAKQGDNNKALTQFNISVGVTDEFIHAVKNDLDWNLKWGGKIYKTIKAKDLYNLMTQNAFIHNEPGIFNIDTVNKYNNGFYDFEINGVNPCGEIVMPPYNLCCLSSINFTKFITNPFEKNAKIDYNALKNTIQLGIRFLDDVLDVTKYPLDKIKENSLKYRRVGLGFTGFGDMFVMLGVKYGSDESKKITKKLGKFFRDESYRASIELAKEKGKFKGFKNDLLKSKFIKNLPKDIQEDIARYGLRNIGINTTAPTGTTSISVGNNCSSGIEPIFSLEYNRNIRTGQGEETKKEAVKDFAWMEYNEKYKEKLSKEQQEHIEKCFITTFDIETYDAIDIQAIWQKYIDHSISKTLNLPTGTTYEEYSKLFMYAYDNELKGFTTFNPSGSMKGILEMDTKENSKIEVLENGVIKRPKKVYCDIHETQHQGVKFLILVGLIENKPYEIFVAKNKDNEFDIQKNKKGILEKVKRGKYSLKDKDNNILIDNIIDEFEDIYLTLGRFISMSLRHNVELQFIIDNLQKNKGFIGFEKTLSRILKKYIQNGEKDKSKSNCPECGNNELEFREGCLTCTNCGWSKCS